VLSHPAVGCFVTHYGWNSVLESVASGVPMVGVPKVSEQSTNARLIKREWRVSVRAHVSPVTQEAAAPITDDKDGDSRGSAEASN
jgi:UDP:flavonoid glycosyltransferase YjiC (YdhE family)